VELSVVHPLCRSPSYLSETFRTQPTSEQVLNLCGFPFCQLLPPFTFQFGRRLLFFLFTQMLSGSICFVCSSLQLPEQCRDVLQGREGRQSWLQTSRTPTRNCLVREIPTTGTSPRGKLLENCVFRKHVLYLQSSDLCSQRNFEDDSARIAQCQKARPPSRPATLEDGEENPFEGSHQGAIILNPRSSNFHTRAWAQTLIGMQARDQERPSHRTAGLAFRNLGAHEYGSPTDYLKKCRKYMAPDGRLGSEDATCRKAQDPNFAGFRWSG
jgi:ABC-transporter N-terminal